MNSDTPLPPGAVFIGFPRILQEIQEKGVQFSGQAAPHTRSGVAGGRPK